MCGGATTAESMPRATWGRSPRVRGSRSNTGRCLMGERSIPACAGEPLGQRPAWPVGRVDPRVCGGAEVQLARVRHCSGRSPRVRGSRMPKRREIRTGGSIPACAGEPCADTRRGTRTRVDPRVCGGATKCGAVAAAVTGRSPRVRGSLARQALPAQTVRSIPACAGEP